MTIYTARKSALNLPNTIINPPFFKPIPTVQISNHLPFKERRGKKTVQTTDEEDGKIVGCASSSPFRNDHYF